MKKRTKQIFTFLMSLTLLFTCVPTGFAASAGSLQDADYNPWDEQETIERVSGLLDTGFEPTELAGWAVAQILPNILGIEKETDSEKILRKLDEVLANQELIKDAISKIDQRIVKAEVASNLNSYFCIDKGQLYDTWYKALQDIDNQSTSPDSKATDRLDLLIKGMTGKDEVMDTLYDFESIPIEMGDFFINGVMVTYSADRDNVFGLYHKWLTYKYHWEHQSYKDWISFRNYVYTQYCITAAVEKMSLMARINKLDSLGKSHNILSTRLSMLKDQIEKVGKIYRGDDYWTGIVKQRPDNVRYYWYGDNAKLLYTTAHQQRIPQEENNKKYGITSINYCQGISWHYQDTMSGKKVVIDGPKISFWRPFISYTKDSSDGGGQVLCPSVDWLTQVYKDYNSSTDLYTIFFDKNQGNMKAPSGSSKDWRFVVDPDVNHPMTYYDGGIFHADEIVTPVMKSDTSLVKDARNEKGTDIYWYHYKSSEINSKYKNKNQFIGIGIASDNSQIPDPVVNKDVVTEATKEKVELKATAGKKGITLSWTRAEKGSKYEVFEKKTGAKSFKKIKTVKKNSKNKLTITKGKNKAAYYYVKVTGKVHGKQVTYTSWKVLVYPKNGKYTNVKSIKLPKKTGAELTLKVGRTKKLGAKATKVNKSKKLPPNMAAIRYISSDKKVATVSSSGKVTAKKAGSCYIYAYGTNGVSKAVHMTVK